MAQLQGSQYWDYFPLQLKNHLQSQELQDTSVDYKLPTIHEPALELTPKPVFITKPADARLPARIASALIPYPEPLRDFVRGGCTKDRDRFHGHHSSQLETLEIVASTLEKQGKLPSAEKVFDIDSVKRFARQRFSRREQLIAHAASAFAKRATMHDLSITAGVTVPFTTTPTRVSNYIPFIIMVQRLRVHIAKERIFLDFASSELPDAPEEATYTMYTNGVYVYHSNCTDHEFYIIACGGHFRMYHRTLNYWFCGPTTYLDYVFSIADILNNIDVLRACEDYGWALETFDLMILLAETEGCHKHQVDFMKGMEGFLLTMSDYDEEHAMNWKPILETTKDLWKLDMVISNCTYDYGLILALMSGKSLYYPKTSFLCRIIICSLKLTRTQRQEISALHKLIFYAEVSAEAGVMKFLKRVHTPRNCDPVAVRNLTRHAKQLFLIAYKNRHKGLPNMIAPVEKVRVLESYTRRGDTKRIEMLPLGWWDDVKIFDCMDNTLTDDPLEFAKDKGALKSLISFGPGDSRKELLQVIERKHYTLKEFFTHRTIAPSPQYVLRTCQKSEPEAMKNPARLIEKEREQKWEARLFANAELENKHSLSLVAAKMKKALSYFDEQLMTPTDKKRKALIHDAARDLSHPDNYSLLLDIEGHNQSMQHSNTSELAEFIGHLFGYEGWGDLPHYFSQLTVYHYDEYMDSVIESHGQLGGIEGWLNPFWTLHTLLGMKLLRIMTDLTVPKIMVYSDDVNAIVSIPQASEPMVQSVFQKVMSHFTKFGMTVKYSQTTLSKHRITMLRQHYADGVRADSTLKRLLSVSAGNNPILVADELEVAGICSSAASALELSNHNEACSYLKNYKLGLLLSRLTQMVLKNAHQSSMLAPEELPQKVANVLYYVKEDQAGMPLFTSDEIHLAAVNDIKSYLCRNSGTLNSNLLDEAVKGVYGVGVAHERMIDSPDRVLYLQIYDEFIQDLLFYWAYLPTGLGGLGASLHINLVLSGHSIGLTKALHYLTRWATSWSSDQDYFLRYLSTSLSVDLQLERNLDESRLASSNWPNDNTVTPVTTSVQQAIKHMVRRRTVNEDILKLFELADDREKLGSELVEIFRENFHSRIVQFYHETTAMHFVDLLLNKVETSSGLLSKVRHITRLRHSLSSRAVENIRNSATTHRTHFFALTASSDIVECLQARKQSMFPKVKFIPVEEILYDDKVAEVDRKYALVTVRRCSPTHYRDGRRVYDDPRVGNETLYKGELIDDSRMLGHKEELLAAKLVAVTKWFLTKSGSISSFGSSLSRTDVVTACNLSLSTLTNQTFSDLVNFAPTETGGEILHRIPNIRFSTSTYIRAEMNLSLTYTTDLNQQLMSTMGLVDSNVNVDYLRMRLLLGVMVRDKYPALKRLVVRYGLSNLIGIRDVQFVTPMVINYRPTHEFKCYGDIREHILSAQRFRYLAHSYMYEENMSEWALMPTMREEQTAQQIGEAYINDVILRYARDLDKDYLLVHPTIIDKNMWEPLIRKLDIIDRTWRPQKDDDGISAIRDRLLHTLNERGRLTLLNPQDKVVLELQKQCLEQLEEIRPTDDGFGALARHFSRAGKSRRLSSKMNIRLAKYQSALSEYTEHKLNLALHLIAEYILTFHFQVQRKNGDVSFWYEKAFSEFVDARVGGLSMMIAAPELQFQLLVLGQEYVTDAAISHESIIKSLLEDISGNVSLVDIGVPVELPSLQDYTLLTGEEEIPYYLEEIEYISTPVKLSSMATMDEILPLCKFAHRCSTTGASPEAFTSYTGSDSLGAQLGLFRMLKTSHWVDTDTQVCDLTAGRGDGVYALEFLGIPVTAYSRKDTFTKLNHHPDIVFKENYDIFDGSTLKFLTQFEHIHVDLSFPGSSDENLLDLVLMLEENNLQYTIRLNSVGLSGYTKAATDDLPPFDHAIAYAANARMKPYQIYLCGRPSSAAKDWTGPPLRSSMAFRAMTVSFAKLLSPANYELRLAEFAPNSVSLQMPTGSALDEFIKKIAEDSIAEEQKYYLARYIQEIGAEAVIAVVPQCCSHQTVQLLKQYDRIFPHTPPDPYGKLGPDCIGNVSKKSRPYHERHVAALTDPATETRSIPLLWCDEAVLMHFRVHHPVAEVRTWCNIGLGLLRFCRTEFSSGHAALEALNHSLTSGIKVQTSSHQREIFMALKLLLISASRDDFAYGVNFCRGLISKSTAKTKGLHRTLRIYKLISYLFPHMRMLLTRGRLDIRSLESIANSIEVRERARYRYVRSIQPPALLAADPELAEKIIANSIESLLEGLERYSQSLVEIGSPEDTSGNLEDVFTASGMVFDIGIETQVDEMIERLGLKPSGPHGIIDLGDDYIEEYDDW